MLGIARMKISYILVPLLLSACTPTEGPGGSTSAGQTDAGVSSSGLGRISQVVQGHIDSGDVPGAIVLAAHRGEIVFREAWGVADRESESPLQPDTVFWMASMTKPFVAAAILQMREEGRLELDDAVSEFIPEFSRPSMVRIFAPGALESASGGLPGQPAVDPEHELSPAVREITVRDLLTHTSGLQTIGIPNASIPILDHEQTLASYIPQLADVPLDFQPGTQWAYSNATGFDVLARIVEVASGQTFEEFIRERLFNPLGITDASFGPRADLASRTAPLGGNFAGLMNHPCVADTNYDCGSAGLWMTADDYWRFAQMLANRGTFDGRRVMEPDSVDLMVSNHTGDLFPGTGGISADGSVFGLSVLIVQDPDAAGVTVPAGSFGWDGVGSRRFWVWPEDEVVIVMLLPGGDAPPVHRSIENAVSEALL